MRRDRAIDLFVELFTALHVLRRVKNAELFISKSLGSSGAIEPNAVSRVVRELLLSFWAVVLFRLLIAGFQGRSTAFA